MLSVKPGAATMTSDDSLIQQYAGLVKSIAHKMIGQLNLNCELQDLVACGYRGLIEAEQRFDATRGVQFNTFAYYRIRGAMLDEVRKMGYMSRTAYAQLKTAEASNDVLEQNALATARPQTPQQSLHAIQETFGRISAAFVLNALGQEEQAADPSNPEATASAKQESSKLHAAVAKLPERERLLITGFYFEHRTFDDVAKTLNISKSWASRLHTKALDLLRQALEELA